MIAICGKKNSGKSLVALYYRQYGYKIDSFAAPLKEICKIFGFTDRDLVEKERVNQQLGISARQFMQQFGTDIMRNKFPEVVKLSFDNIWIKLMNDRLTGKTVIDDLRFLDEAEFVKKKGGLIIRVLRGIGDDHISETETDQIDADITIENNGTIFELFQKLNQINRDR